jgi:hypothetical protein
MYESDHNIHKSNSSYFSDFDVSRSHIVGAILRKGILAASKSDSAAKKHNMALGGVAAIFKREIRPYEKFEIWTRVLAWDRKWIYFVSHMVKAGTVKPSKYTLQPWKKGRAKTFETKEEHEAYREQLKKSILATSIAKYVVKNGRITVPTDVVMESSGLIPPKLQNASGDTTVTANGETETLDNSILPSNDSEWTWESVEAERLRGLKFAEMFAGLDGLHDVFDGGENGALGEYPDLL